MHKTKENTANPSKIQDQDIQDAIEMANEEEYEAVGGETSTEGVGRGFDAEGPDASAGEKAESSADGPMSGERADPPSEWPGRERRARKRRVFKDSPRDHVAANNPKAF